MIKLDNTISPFSTFTFLLGSCNGHYQGDVTVLDKSTPQEQAHVAFFKLSCENWMCSIPFGLLEEKYLVPPHTSTPPGSTCRVFTSPPPPLVIRKLQGGGTSNLVPNKSCCRWILSVQNKYSMVVQLPIRRKIEKYRSDLPGNLKVSRVTCSEKKLKMNFFSDESYLVMKVI